MSNNSDPEGKTLAERICDGEQIQWQPSTEAPKSNRRAALQLLDTISRTYRHNRQNRRGLSNAESWGHLQLLGSLGEGTFGKVYRAFDPLLQREVALKLAQVEGGQARQWINEARRLSRISHPNVVAIHGAEIHDGRAGIWFERVEGQSLQQWIAQQGPLGAGELIAVGQSLCAAVAAVHAAGLIHGDIKPANILREIGGRIVLLDFGSSRELGADSLATGSLPYLAPELLDGGPPSVATDIYALGKTLRALLVDPAGDADSLSGNLLDSRPDLPPALARCIDAACANVASQRPVAVGSLATALGASLEARPTNTRGHRTLSYAGIIALAGLVLGGTLWAARSWMQAHAPLLDEVSLITRDASGKAQPISNPLQVGAPLALQLTTTRPVFVYVLNQDDQGRSHVLYPLESMAQALPAGKNIELPGRVAGRAMDWQVDSVSSEERFAVVAAIERQGDLEQLLTDWSRAGQSSAASDQAVRGIGGLVQRNAHGQGDMADLIEPFQQKVDVEVHLLTLSAD